MGEEGLWGLGVVVPAVAHCAVGGADGEPPHVVLPTCAVPVLGRLVGDLVKGREDVVCKLDLGDGGVPLCSGAHPEPHDALL